MALTQEEYEEVSAVGRTLDSGVGCLPDDMWDELVARYHELQAKMAEKSAQPSA